MPTRIPLWTSSHVSNKWNNPAQQLWHDQTTSESIDECIEEDHKALYDSDLINRINASGIPEFMHFPDQIPQ